MLDVPRTADDLSVPLVTDSPEPCRSNPGRQGDPMSVLARTNCVEYLVSIGRSTAKRLLPFAVSRVLGVDPPANKPVILDSLNLDLLPPE